MNDLPLGGAPAHQVLDELLGIDSSWVRHALGAAVVSIRPLSAFRQPQSPRMAFRLDLDDGRVIKLRRFADPERARVVHQLLEEASSEDFSPVVSRLNGLLLEGWVDGQALDRAADPTTLIDAGALLGRLHVLKSASGAPWPTSGSTANEHTALRGDLSRLRDGNILGDEAFMLVLAAAARHDPGTSTFGVTHNDFSAENIIKASTGRLVVIDNEHLRIGPLDGDLVRSLEQWGMDAAGRKAFMLGYSRYRDPAGALLHRLFWRLRSLALSARVRLNERDQTTANARARTMLDLAKADGDVR